MLQAELGNSLASLLLVPGVDGDGAASWDGGIALALRVGAVACVLDVDLLLRLVGELFNAWVGHLCDGLEGGIKLREER